MKKKLQNVTKKVLAKLPDEKSFRFYTSINNPTGKIARSLEEFVDNIKKIDLPSIEFHKSRGDFSNWVSDTLKDNVLARNLKKIRGLKGEKLRKKLIQTVETRLSDLKSLKPKPKKTKVKKTKTKKPSKKKKK